MATTPAQKRTPRRSAGAPAAKAAPVQADTLPAVTAASAPAAKPATKAAAKSAPKSAAQAAAKPARKTAAPKTAPKAAAAEAAPVAPAAPAAKKTAKPAAEPAAKAPAKRARAKVTDAPAAEPAEAAPEAAPAAKKTAAKKVAAKKVAAKKVAVKQVAAQKVAAKKVAAKKPATKASARKPVATPAEPAPAAEAVPETAATASAPSAPSAPSAGREPSPAPARKRSNRKTAAEPAVATDAQAAAEPPVEATPEVPPAPVAAPAAAEPGPAEAASLADEASETAEAAASDDTEDSAPEAGAAPARERNRRNRRRGRDRDRQRDRAERPADADAAADATGNAPAEAASQSDDIDAEKNHPTVDAPTAAPAEEPIQASPPAAPARPERPQRPPRPAPSGPAHSTLQCLDGDRRRIVWHTGHAASDSLYFAAQECLGADGLLADDDDDSLPRLLREAGDEGHRVEVDPAVWAQLAARRDARTRAGVLMAAYPDGPASPALRHLLAAPLPLYQAEGALWAVIAGRGLLADERGLGKSVQAIAAAQLWRRHFGVRRVAVISGAGERLAWQRAWRRFAGVDAQVMEGGLHQRQAFWSQDSEVRILAPEALSSDAAHLAHWAPELVIVDEPQRLALDGDAWAALDQAPQALVLCGAALDDQPSLLESLVAWLDRDRLGALAALREVQDARAGRTTLDEAGVERVSDALSRSVLQRQRAEVADQLPALVYSERIVPLAPAQREAHDRLLATLRRGLSGWQASGYLSDTDQWRLATTLRAALAACHRADPAVADSPLAEGLVQAAADQLRAWAPDHDAAALLQVLLLCDTEADLAQLGAALDTRGLLRDGLQLALAGQPVTLAADAVLQVGVPWRTRRAALLPAGAATDAQPGQQWLLLVAQDSLEAALFDTLAGRADAPRSAADPGSRGFLQGERLLAWLQAIQAALQAMPADVPSVGGAG